MCGGEFALHELAVRAPLLFIFHLHTTPETCYLIHTSYLQGVSILEYLKKNTEYSSISIDTEY